MLETGRRRFPETERPHEAARFAHNLGCAFCDLGQTGAPRATDRGIIHLRRAARIRSAAKDRRMAAQSLDALGTAWRERRRGDRARNLTAAVEAHEDALETRLRINLPDEAARSAHNLALALCERGHGADWERVALVARRMVFDNEARFQGTRYGEEHRRLVGDIGGLKDMGVLALLNTDDAAKAEAFARQGRARLQRLWTGEAAMEAGADRPEEPTLTILAPPGAQGSLAFVSDGRNPVTPILLPALSRDWLDGVLEGEQGWFAALAALRRDEYRAFEARLDQIRPLLRGALSPIIEALKSLAGQPLRLSASGTLAILPIGDLLAEAIDAPVIHATGGGAGVSAAACRSALIVADAEADRPLPHGRREAAWIADLLPEPPRALIGPEATRRAVLDALQRSEAFDILHLSCHAHFDWRDPDRSGLSLAGGEALTFADLRALKELRAPRLVVLSACETGATGFRDLPDEAYGLPLAFLAAGTSGVVSALWPVADRSMALLMRRFHELHLGGAHPAAASRGAQLWLRDATAAELADYVAEFGDGDAVRGFGFANLGDAKGAPPSRRPFEHPWHWAGFIYSKA